MMRALAGRAFWLALICAAVLTATTSAALAQAGDGPPERDPAAEKQILDRLALISSEAVPLFAMATQALDAGEMEAAAAGVRQVLELAPRFPDASRRLSEAELALGDVGSARRHAFRAHGYAPSPINLAAIASALVAAGDETRTGDAWIFARAAALALPEETALRRLHVEAAIATREQGAVDEACTRLVEVAPDDAYGRYCNGIGLANTGEWAKAEGELLLSVQLGVPERDVEWALANDISRRAWFERRVRAVVWPMLGYALAPLYLLAAGLGLGRMTVALARRAVRRRTLGVSVPERFLHGAYRVVIVLTSAWYYASVPLLWLALVAAWIGTFLLAYAGEPIWIRVVVVLSLMMVQYVLATVYVGLTARVKHPDPGRPVGRSDAPGLWDLVLQTADRLHTRPIDAVYAIPDARIAVQEEGRTWDLVRGRGQRCLVLGLGLVPRMTERQLKAVLAHEYAHFANRDTAGGQLARQVHASLQRMAVQLTMVGQNKWYSPGWWYVSAFTRIFLLVTMGASRLHEILADRVAADV